MCAESDELCGVPAVQTEWIDSLVSKLQQVINLNELILFGSRARGEHITCSDYDICVVSDDFTGVKLDERMELVLKMWSGQRALEPLCYTKDEFAQIEDTLIGQVIRQGKRLYI